MSDTEAAAHGPEIMDIVVKQVVEHVRDEHGFHIVLVDARVGGTVCARCRLKFSPDDARKVHALLGGR